MGNSFRFQQEFHPLHTWPSGIAYEQVALLSHEGPNAVRCIIEVSHFERKLTEDGFHCLSTRAFPVYIEYLLPHSFTLAHISSWSNPVTAYCLLMADHRIQKGRMHMPIDQRSFTSLTSGVL